MRKYFVFATFVFVVMLVSAGCIGNGGRNAAQKEAAATAAATTVPTVVATVAAQPTTAVQPTPTPTPTATATSAPAVTPSTTGTTANFNPYPFYSQSCGPEENSLGGCTWDIGTMGNLVDPQGRQATQIGIVKGVSVSWNGKTANSSTNGRCAVVILTPNSWFENLTVKDSNVTVYNVSTSDVSGWEKTLAVQAAYEQQSDYGCPAKAYPQDFDVWGSSIPSPPNGTMDATGSTSQSSSTAVSQPQATQPAATATSASTSATATCDTVDCLNPRIATADTGGSASFHKGEAVAGYKITIGSNTYGQCYFKSAPGDGTVVDGVVHPWKTEVANLKPCS